MIDLAKQRKSVMLIIFILILGTPLAFGQFGCLKYGEGKYYCNVTCIHNTYNQLPSYKNVKYLHLKITNDKCPKVKLLDLTYAYKELIDLHVHGSSCPFASLDVDESKTKLETIELNAAPWKPLGGRITWNRDLDHQTYTEFPRLKNLRINMMCCDMVWPRLLADELLRMDVKCITPLIRVTDIEEAPMGYYGQRSNIAHFVAKNLQYYQGHIDRTGQPPQRFLANLLKLEEIFLEPTSYLHTIKLPNDFLFNLPSLRHFSIFKYQFEDLHDVGMRRWPRSCKYLNANSVQSISISANSAFLKYCPELLKCDRCSDNRRRNKKGLITNNTDNKLSLFEQFGNMNPTETRVNERGQRFMYKYSGECETTMEDFFQAFRYSFINVTQLYIYDCVFNNINPVIIQKFYQLQNIDMEFINFYSREVEVDKLFRAPNKMQKLTLKLQHCDPNTVSYITRLGMFLRTYGVNFIVTCDMILCERLHLNDKFEYHPAGHLCAAVDNFCNQTLNCQSIDGYQMENKSTSTKYKLATIVAGFMQMLTVFVI